MNHIIQMDDIKNNTTNRYCPLCGSAAVDVLKGITCRCSNNECPLAIPISITKWRYRPIEGAMQVQMNKDKNAIKEMQRKIDANDDAINYVTKSLKQIASMDVTIILKNGKTINSGQLARDSLEKIMNRYAKRG